MLFVAEPPLNITSPGPVICSPPPFPGFGVVMEFPSKVIFVNVYVSPAIAFNSIPPPARLALFPETVAPFTVKVPGVKLNTPPPEPAAPVAAFPVIIVFPSMVKSAPLLYTPPPPSVAVAAVAVLFEIVAPEIVAVVLVPLVLLSIKIPPPMAAVLFEMVPPVIPNVSVSVTYNPRPAFPVSRSTFVS